MLTSGKAKILDEFIRNFSSMDNDTPTKLAFVNFGKSLITRRKRG